MRSSAVGDYLARRPPGPRGPLRLAGSRRPDARPRRAPLRARRDGGVSWDSAGSVEEESPMRERTLSEWWNWGRWAGHIVRILLNPRTFFIVAWQQYGTDQTLVTVHFHSGRTDKKLVELDCLQRAGHG